MSAHPEKPHVSYSQLNLFANCAEAYRRRYIENEIIPPGIAALRGRAVHVAAELNHRQKLTTGVDLPLQDLVDAAATGFDTAKREGYWLTPDEESEGADHALGHAKDRAVKLTGLYASAVAPAIQPAMVEERIRIVLPDSPADILGVLDVATTDGRIKDLKTAGRSKSQLDADTSLQLSVYALTYHAKTGQHAAGCDMEVLVDTAVPKHQRLTTVRTRRDFEVLVARTNALLNARKAGIFPPANLGHWLCGPKYCGYFLTGCPYVNADRRAAAQNGEEA
jgi:PD-(D/E)XK nuclease superfamily